MFNMFKKAKAYPKYKPGSKLPKELQQQPHEKQMDWHNRFVETTGQSLQYNRIGNPTKKQKN